MKKNYFILFFLSALIVGCNNPPENYNKGIEKQAAKEYETAIEFLKLVGDEDKEWKDSANVRIDELVKSIFSTNDINRIVKFSRKSIEDSLLTKKIITTALNQWDEKLSKNNALEAFDFFDSLRFMYKGVPGIDVKIRNTEDAFFKGVWKCHKGTLKGNEIYFDRDEDNNLVQGKSNKNTNGWNLGKVIYKDIFYIGNHALDHRVRVYNTDYWGDQIEYFTKTKGSMTILSADSILVNYEGSVGSGNKVYFVKKEAENKKLNP